MGRNIRKSGKPGLQRNDASLWSDIRELILEARRTVARGVNAALVWTNFEIGRRIVEHEQKGKARAGYAEEILKVLSQKLTDEFGRGYSVDNLERMRRFYLMYRKSATVSRKSPLKFPLSWSHYLLLMDIKNEHERRFYEIEATNQNWSLAELRRQHDSSLYERLALSRDKAQVKALSEKGQIVIRPEDMLKDPYVLEFLGLEGKPVYSEDELESSIISKIEHFLLELGKGFLFEARQKRFTFDDEHYYVDLVFYNRLLRCYALIDLKIGKLSHQDLGQMQMYVNYYDRFVKTHEENKTVGIILCKRKNDSLVEITLPEHSRVFARKYQLYLPTKAELKAQLDEKV